MRHPMTMESSVAFGSRRLRYICKQIDPALYDLLFGKCQAPDGTPLGKPPGGSRKAADVHSALLAAEPHATRERDGPQAKQRRSEDRR
jgi:hypothetical protein